MKCGIPLGSMVLTLVGTPFLASALEYERDIQPIFKEKCYDCHSAESDKVKGGLKLDDADHFLGRFEKNDVIVPGDWDASYLFVTITRPHNAKEAMPPKDKGTPLTPEEIMKVANWIHEGAKVGRKSGDVGPDEFKPEAMLRFNDEGQLIIRGLVDDPAETDMMTKKKPEATVREWTNLEGTKLRAILRGVEGTTAVLELENGKVARYPINKLSAESQKLVKELTSGDAEPLN